MRKETGGKRLQVTITRLTELPNAASVIVPAPPPASPATPAATGRAVTVAVPPDAGWDVLTRQYRQAHEIAVTLWGDIDDQALVAATATVFIEANKRGLTVPAPHVPLTKEEREANAAAAHERFKEMPKVLEDEDEDLPF